MQEEEKRAAEMKKSLEAMKSSDHTSDLQKQIAETQSRLNEEIANVTGLQHDYMQVENEKRT